MPVGWTPDGKSILFRSPRASYARFLRLFTVPVERRAARPSCRCRMAEDGSLSPDGKRIAYVPLSNKPQFPGAFRPVRNYRGGTAVAALDRRPGRLGDHQGAAHRLQRLQPDVGRRPRLLPVRPRRADHAVRLRPGREGGQAASSTRTATDIKSASACADAIVYDRFGTLHLFDLKTEKSKPIPVRVAADLPGVRPKVEKVNKTIQSAGLSPTGSRAVFEARGEILTVPAEKGDVRNLTNTPGAAERDPAWSPDGKSIAYFSDESGEYELHVRPQDGRGEVKKIKLGDGAVVLLQPGLVAGRQEDRLHRQAAQPVVRRPRQRQVHEGRHRPVRRRPARPGRLVAGQQVAGLPAAAQELPERDLPLLAGDRQGAPGHRRHERRPLPAFDKGGKYLYFTASTDIGPSVGSGMSILNRPVTRAAYVVVLSKDDPSPLAPESDDEKEKKDADKEKEGQEGRRRRSRRR